MQLSVRRCLSTPTNHLVDNVFGIGESYHQSFSDTLEFRNAAIYVRSLEIETGDGSWRFNRLKS